MEREEMETKFIRGIIWQASTWKIEKEVGG